MQQRSGAGRVSATPRRHTVANAWTPIGSATKKWRSTTSARKASHRKLSETRPIGDRAFIKASIAKLSAYLRAAGFAGSASNPRVLSRPTTRDFQEVAGFLLSRLDPTWSRGDRRFEDEFVEALRLLQYPFTLSKTALAAVGTAHTWPALLAALAWIVDLLEYDEQWQARRQKGTFHEYVAEAYSLFLAGDDDACGALRQRLKAAFESVEADAGRQAEAAEARARDAEIEVKAFRDEAATLPRLLERRSQLRQAKTAVEATAADADAEARRAERRAAQATCRAAAAAARLRDALEGQRRLAEARDKVENEAEARARLLQEREVLEAELAATRAKTVTFKKRLDDASFELRTRVETAADNARRYDRSAHSLQLVPATAKNADGRDLSLDVRRDGDDLVASSTSAQDASLKARDVVKPALAELHDALRARSLEVRRKVAAAKRDLEALEVDRAAADDALDAAKHGLNNAEHRFARDLDRGQRGRTSAARDAKLLGSEADALASTLDTLRDDLDAKRAALVNVEANVAAELESRAADMHSLRAQLAGLAQSAVDIGQRRDAARRNLAAAITDAKASLHADARFLDRANGASALRRRRPDAASTQLALTAKSPPSTPRLPLARADSNLLTTPPPPRSP